MAALTTYDLFGVECVFGRRAPVDFGSSMRGASNAKLQAKTADLEARSRHKNICIICLPESIEGPRPTAFFSDLLPQLLGDQILPTSTELVRAHRSLDAKPKPGERQRPVIIRFHNFQTKERVIREARKMRADLRYEGKPIAFYKDYIHEVVMQRALYREVMVQLYKLGLRPALQYPAKLMITRMETKFGCHLSRKLRSILPLNRGSMHCYKTQ
ncbi:hypothetical protein KUCAC02_032950 [Chaenocephalus aceratus]|nr:hypothetical protein KUCAC02_032950 [Chaenocephalus aceratus]